AMPRSARAAEVVDARPQRLVPLSTFAEISESGTNVASSGGQGVLAPGSVGSGELMATLNVLGRMHTQMAPAVRPLTSMTAIRVPKMTVWPCCRCQRRAARARTRDCCVLTRRTYTCCTPETARTLRSHLQDA